VLPAPRCRRPTRATLCRTPALRVERQRSGGVRTDGVPAGDAGPVRGGLRRVAGQPVQAGVEGAGDGVQLEEVDADRKGCRSSLPASATRPARSPTAATPPTPRTAATLAFNSCSVSACTVRYSPTWNSRPSPGQLTAQPLGVGRGVQAGVGQPTSVRAEAAGRLQQGQLPAQPRAAKSAGTGSMCRGDVEPGSARRSLDLRIPDPQRREMVGRRRLAGWMGDGLLVVLHAAGGWLLLVLEVRDRPGRVVWGRRGVPTTWHRRSVWCGYHPVRGPSRPIVGPRFEREGLARLPVLNGAVVAGSGRWVVVERQPSPSA
jgi:hypothetical protein